MTQLLDPSGPFACVWDEAIDGCEIPEPQPLINPHISEADKLCFVFGCDAPPRDLSAPEVVPLPAGGLLLATALCAVLAIKYLIPRVTAHPLPADAPTPLSLGGVGAPISEIRAASRGCLAGGLPANLPAVGPSPALRRRGLFHRGRA